MMMDVILTTYQGAILGPIARILGYILQALYEALSVIGIQNTGICIILFTFLVNALMMPMQIKQQKFAKMSAIMNPEIMAIQDKYKNKKDQASQQKMSLETQAVYQKYGVSPASGCLPMLITFPIIFALYRVIYNIPAYVPQIYKIYEDVAEALINAKVTVEALSGKEYITSSTYVVTQAVNSAKTDGSNINYFIDVLSQFSSSGWDALATAYPQLADVITSTASQAAHINSFLGLNISDTPSLKSISIIIPILSVITQIISMKISMAGNTQQTSSENPTAATMKTMNNVMPFISGFMCLMFPIGVGIYWIAGNIFRILQSLFVNISFNKMNMEEEIQKNIEKAKKKYERMGMDSSVLENAAKTRTSNIKLDKPENKKENKQSSVGSGAKAQSQYKDTKKTNTKYKEGSIAAYANLLNREDK